MTAPLPQAPDPEQLAAETAAVVAVVDRLRAQIRTATQRIFEAYVAAAGSLNNPLPAAARRQFIDFMQAQLTRAGTAGPVREYMWAAIWRALTAGQRTAVSYLEQARDLIPYGAAAHHERIAGALSAIQTYGREATATGQWAGNVAANAAARLEAQLASARSIQPYQLPQEVQFADVLAALAPVNEAANALERDTRWAVNAAFNQAARDLSDQAGVGRMWVAERDACLHCLALSGTIAQPGQPFDGQLTYYIDKNGGYKPLSVHGGLLWGPPRHPNCRCYAIPVPVLDNYPVMPWETEPYHPAQALQREARRSVLRGDSGSDSLPARLRATDQLLAVGAGLPVTVQRRARRAVRRRRYEDRRWDRP